MYLYCISLKERHFRVLIIGFMIVCICDGMVGRSQILVNVFVVQWTSAIQVIIYLLQWFTAYITYYCRCFALCVCGLAGVWFTLTVLLWAGSRVTPCVSHLRSAWGICSSETAKTNQKSSVCLKAYTWSWSTIISTQHTIGKACQMSKLGINGSGRGALPVGDVEWMGRENNCWRGNILIYHNVQFQILVNNYFYLVNFYSEK